MTATPTAEESTRDRANQSHSNSSSMSKGITLGLARITRLLDVLGNPHLAVPIIHVAGTNGKGSVCAYIDSILRASGFRVGRFTSPHLVDVRDSITLQGKPVLEADYRKAVTKIEDANAKYKVEASPFEMLAATAFQTFKDSHPPLDVAVIEVGMGGSTDATNVCPNPLVTAIASIDMDHQAFLGNTIEEIATVKAGIIKHDRPCILAPQNYPEAAEAVRTVAEQQEAPVIEVSSSAISTDGISQFSFRGTSIDVRLPLLGSYQGANAATAVSAVEALCQSIELEKAARITPATVKTGLESTRWPGRLDWVEHEGQKLLLDGAHNPASIKELANFLQTLPPKPSTFVVGLSAPRDPLGLLEPLVAAHADGQLQVVATGFTQPEGMPWVSAVNPSDIAQAAKSLGIQAQAANTVQEALSITKRHPNNRIVICGSLYLVADTYRLLH